MRVARLGPDKSPSGSPRHRFSTPRLLLPPPMRDSKNATPNTSSAARMTQPEPGIGKKKAMSTAMSDRPITWFNDTRDREPPAPGRGVGAAREGFSNAGADLSAGRLRTLRGFSGTKSSILRRISSISFSMRSAKQTTPEANAPIVRRAAEKESTAKMYRNVWQLAVSALKNSLY